MRTVRRFDSTKLPKAEVTREGFLRAPMTLSRVGVYEYRDGKGNTTRELRLPEDVFDPDSLASFSMAPITDGHPSSGSVTAENARDLQRGHLSETINADEKRGVVEALGMITDGVLVEKVQSGDAAELSAGYTCVLLDESGEHEEFGAYDCRQTKIRGNHVAVVTDGRAGPECRVRLDENDAVSVQRRDDTPFQGERTMKMTIRGASVEVPDTIAALFEAERQDAASILSGRDAAIVTLTAERDSARAETTTVAARADSLDVRVKRLDAWIPMCFGRMMYAACVACQACPSKADCASLQGYAVPGDPASTTKVDGKDVAAPTAKEDAARLDGLKAYDAKILEGARVRADLEQFATKIGVEVKTDASDLDLKRACAAKLSGLNLDDKGADYVGALFDVERKRNDEKPTGASAAPVVERVEPKVDESDEPTAYSRRQEMTRRDSESWKKPIPGAVTLDNLKK